MSPDGLLGPDDEERLEPLAERHVTLLPPGAATPCDEVVHLPELAARAAPRFALVDDLGLDDIERQFLNQTERYIPRGVASHVAASSEGVAKRLPKRTLARTLFAVALLALVVIACEKLWSVY